MPGKTGTGKEEKKLRPENTPLEHKSKTASIQVYRALANRPEASREIAEALGQPFSPQTAHIAALVLIHALAQTRGEHPPTRAGVLGHWTRIIEPGSRARFRPIIPLALRLLRALPARTAERAVQEMTGVSEQLHDPAGTGQVIQKLADQRKQLAVYHTRPDAAALMAHLAVPQDLDWSNPETLTRYRMADYSCGAGDLLTAAYRRVRELHRQAGGSPREIHAAMLEHAITAVDILPASVALAAAGLDALEPEPAPSSREPATRALTLRYGPINYGIKPRGIKPKGPQEPRPAGLGSLDLLDPVALHKQELRPIARGTACERLEFPAGSQDLVIMNPPFTKSPDPQALDRNLPDPERGIPPTSGTELARLENRIAKIHDRVKAGAGNGLSLHFAHLAHRMVKRGGSIALLLPMSALTAGGGAGETHGNRRPDLGWPVFRRKLITGYTGVQVIGIAGFEEQGSTFSHDTHIAEIMLVDRRTRVGEPPGASGCFINLKRRPEDEAAAARLSQAINETVRRLENELPGTTRDLTVNGQIEGNVVRDILPRHDIWPLSRVLDPGLVQAVDALKKGKIHGGWPGEPVNLPIAALGDLARVGTAGHEAEKLLSPVRPGKQGIPMLRGHDCASQRTLEIPRAEEYRLQPGQENRENRLTGTMSRLHFNDNFRYNSQSTAALTTPEPSVGGRGWPNLRAGDERQEKALAVWLNTSLGLLVHWAMSSHTQNGLGYASRKQIKNMPVLDTSRLTHRQLELLSETFNQAKDLPMLPANEAWRDRIRAELDRRVLEEALGLGEEATELARSLCRRWCLEPTVQGRKGRVVKRQPDMKRLEELAGAARPQTHRTTRDHARSPAGDQAPANGAAGSERGNPPATETPTTETPAAKFTDGGEKK